MVKLRIVAIAALGIAIVAPAHAQDAYDGEWHYTLAPYLWLPSFHGSLRFDLPFTQVKADVTVNPHSYLSDLKFALMLAGEARKSNFAIYTDVVYMDLGTQGGSLRSVRGPLGIVDVPIDVGTKISVTGGLWTLAGSYTVARSEAGTLDVLGGFRYAELRTSLDWNVAVGSADLLPGVSGSVSRKAELWDGIVGLRGRLALGSSDWFMPYYADVGTGDAKLTWQVMAGIGYRYRWGDALLTWRHLSMEQRDDKLLESVRLSGPAFGVAFRW